MSQKRALLVLNTKNKKKKKNKQTKVKDNKTHAEIYKKKHLT